MLLDEKLVRIQTKGTQISTVFWPWAPRMMVVVGGGAWVILVKILKRVKDLRTIFRSFAFFVNRVHVNNRRVPHKCYRLVTKLDS